ncbi:procyclic form-specific polypeptide A-beta [Cajanus cajan]|uniref:procyclic form-specific polypeptide A-beta n=1 Tax=Cajanus cajan TaxID=3821 RepID=UPI00098D8598|nr:procyclic form-specific polypeptide A-beta [Cajanus cajan]
MAFIARLCLLFLLLTSADMCFATNNPKEDLNNTDDYPDPGPNPKHNPHPPPPPENRKMKISVDDDHPGTGPSPKPFPFGE